MKEFNLELAKAGHQVCTRDGKPARIICFDSNMENFPIVAIVTFGDNEELELYTEKGKFFKTEQEDEFDLMMVSEVKDDDDKRIKEAISYAIANSTHEDGILLNGVTESEAIAWLEKQGEQKPTDKEMKILLQTEYEKGKADAIEQKSAWSEEDERMVECCKIALGFFEKIGKNTPGFPHENYFEFDEEKIYPDEINRWLKSLRGRVQPKQEWSEKDERMVDGLTSIVEDWYDAESEEEKEYYGDCGYINWLKSLKERYTWKPSEADILLLERIANGKSNPKDFQASLGGLIGRLKELKGE